MADEFERAQELDALAVVSALNLQAMKAAREPKLSHAGECHSPLCGEPVDFPKLFCGATCAKEHAHYSANNFI